MWQLYKYSVTQFCFSWISQVLSCCLVSICWVLVFFWGREGMGRRECCCCYWNLRNSLLLHIQRVGLFVSCLLIITKFFFLWPFFWHIYCCGCSWFAMCYRLSKMDIPLKERTGSLTLNHYSSFLVMKTCLHIWRLSQLGLSLTSVWIVTESLWIVESSICFLFLSKLAKLFSRVLYGMP